MKNSKLILGAIIGDVVGSIYEHNNIKATEFDLFSSNCSFTDDSVLTFATMDVIVNKGNYTEIYQQYARKFTHRGYGGNFSYWIYEANPKPYKSFGNGSAMRVSPVGWAYDNINEVLKQAKKSAEVTHNHREGIKGAQATAAAVFLARTGSTKDEIKNYIQTKFGYDLERTTESIRPHYRFDVTCQGTVPESIIAFLESKDFEHSIRLAISLGGDSDTLACITGAIAEAFYKDIPVKIINRTLKVLPEEIKKLILDFSLKYRE